MASETETLPGRGTTAPLTGLSRVEAESRKARGLANLAQPLSSRGYGRILYENAFTPINSILFVISLALVALGLIGDALMTAGLVLINVVVGVFQEGRAKRRLDHLALLARPQATIIRDGEEISATATEIVMGDLIRLVPGDEIQVDGVVLRCQNFGVDESLLTGESDPVTKQPGDRLYSGSFCVSGDAYFEVDRVGGESMAQKVTNQARSFRNVRTPLQREVSSIILVMAIAVAGLGIAVAGSFLDLYGKLPLHETVRAAAVVVALVPQGLSFMVTVTYAMAAVRISATGALIQRLNAVESMSHIDVLCMDKTGTLTTNALKLDALHPFAIDEAQLRGLLGVFAASASVRNRTTEAILHACHARAIPVAAEVPFNSERKWSGLSFQGAVSLKGTYVLGAPEVVAANLQAVEGFATAGDEWRAAGLRVLVFAQATSELDATNATLPPHLQPLGLIAIRDELRQEARETVERFRQANIQLKVISGDHPETVASLARQTGISSGADAIAGAELDRLSEADFSEAVENNSIFGRVTPDHKERLVRALQQRGHYVAMTGDGVNDVPALKRADVAIAMRSGSAITRGVADIVLLNDSFAVLPAAFSEGQRIRNGMQSIIRLFLVRTLSVSLIILLASLFGDAFPTTPRQAGLLASLTVGFPALMLAIWAKPAHTEEYILPSAADFVLPASVTIAIACFIIYHGFMQSTGDPLLARTALVITGSLCGIVLIPFVERNAGQKDLLPDTEPRLILLALAMFVVLIAAMTIGPLSNFYEMKALSATQYGVVALMVVAWTATLWLIWRASFSFRLRARHLKLG